MRFAALGFERHCRLSTARGLPSLSSRSHLHEHFKEPTSCVSSSMTEDAAVFGGLNNLTDGLANSYNMYKPKMIAVATTCMAEVIGDDQMPSSKHQRKKVRSPRTTTYHSLTPCIAFVGSHVTGYDNTLKGILEHFWDGKAGTAPKLDAQSEQHDQLHRWLRRLHCRKHP
ncbi:nitrogenase component 1 [Bradyrhizobium sp. RDM12]